MKKHLKRMVSAALALCLAANILCATAAPSQAAAYKKTIKKTITFSACDTREFHFKIKSSADVTITATLKGNSEKGHHYVAISHKGKGKTIEVFGIKGKKKAQQKIKFKKGTQILSIGSGGQGTIKLTIEIKAKKPVLQFKSVKKPVDNSSENDVG